MFVHVQARETRCVSCIATIVRAAQKPKKNPISLQTNPYTHKRALRAGGSYMCGDGAREGERNKKS